MLDSFLRESLQDGRRNKTASSHEQAVCGIHNIRNLDEQMFLDQISCFLVEELEPLGEKRTIRILRPLGLVDILVCDQMKKFYCFILVFRPLSRGLDDLIGDTERAFVYERYHGTEKAARSVFVQVQAKFIRAGRMVVVEYAVIERGTMIPESQFHTSVKDKQFLPTAHVYLNKTIRSIPSIDTFYVFCYSTFVHNSSFLS